MEIIKYPSEERVNEGIRLDEPMLAAISFDGKKAIIAQVEDSFEHHIMLSQAGYSQLDIDKFFRIRFEHSGLQRTDRFHGLGEEIIQEFLYMLDYKIDER